MKRCKHTRLRNQLRRIKRRISWFLRHPVLTVKTFLVQLFCKHEVEHYRGYPGEHIYGCKKCGKVFDYDFNIGEVI